jgi:hypothetical protein
MEDKGKQDNEREGARREGEAREGEARKYFPCLATLPLPPFPLALPPFACLTALPRGNVYQCMYRNGIVYPVETQLLHGSSLITLQVMILT